MNLINSTRYFFYSTFYFFLFFNVTNSSLYAFDEKNIQTSLVNAISPSLSKNIEDNPFLDEYILDSGDSLLITFEDLDIFSNYYSIGPEGYLKLPEIGNYYARGKTISEVVSELNKKYKEFIFVPNIKIDISTFRPIKVFISGEINSPGLYNMAKTGGENAAVSQISVSLDETKTINSSQNFPKLFNVLSEAGGVTNYADLSKIEIVRTNPIKNGGGKKKAEINLIDLIIYGNQENNIYIQDDDIINIPKSEKVIKEQFLAINKINLNPSKISIFVSGDVISPGKKDVKKGSALVQAIALTGGKKFLSGKVEFIRFNNEGDIERRLISFNSSAKVDSYNNPLLMEGDIINVQRSAVGTFQKVFEEFYPPIVNSFVLYRLFGLDK